MIDDLEPELEETWEFQEQGLPSDLFLSLDDERESG